MPRVTVVMATYNWSTVLPYSIGSVLRQTYIDFELLVVGDGCTDDSEQVVAAIDDPRVRWIGLPTNNGHQSAPNNEGLRQARGDVIAYLGHDDLWLPHHLEVLVRAIDSEPTDAAFGVVLCIGPDSRFTTALRRLRPGAGAPPSGMVHRRRLTEDIGGWPDYRSLTILPETELFRRALSAGNRFTFVPRLTAIKFPAAWRKNVYQIRPCHEQAEWLARIDSDPDLEAHELAKLAVDDSRPTDDSYAVVVRTFLRETLNRIRRRLVTPGSGGRTLDEFKRFKGL